jgi:hypothetical protein
MRFAVPAQLAVLKSDESDDDNLSAGQVVQPATKFGQVLFIYRLPNLGTGQFKADFYNSRVIAVVA